METKHLLYITEVQGTDRTKRQRGGKSVSQETPQDVSRQAP